MKVFSMFDGVGGFIVGLNNADSTFFQTLYSNQYEPSKKNQDAYEIGCYHFPDIKHIPTDVSLISNEKFLEMRNKDLNPIDFYKSYVYQKGLFAQQFPINPFSSNNISFEHLSNDLTYISNHFNISNNKSCFYNSGIMRYGIYFSAPTEPLNDEKPIALRNILVSENNVPKKFFIEGVKLEKFKYLRGAKKIIRQSSDGHTYTYSEGAMSEFDSIDLPGRTILTSEGSINRSTHLLKINDIYRLLTPIEAERLQDFPDNWTKFKLTSKGDVVEVSDRMRMFCMGNALVTGIVTRIANGIKNIELN